MGVSFTDKRSGRAYGAEIGGESIGGISCAGIARQRLAIQLKKVVGSSADAPRGLRPKGRDIELLIFPSIAVGYITTVDYNFAIAVCGAIAEYTAAERQRSFCFLSRVHDMQCSCLYVISS